MTARRLLAGLALLLAVPTAAACAQAVPGSGTIAADVQGGGAPTGTSAPSPTDSGGGPTETSSSSSSSMPSPTASSSGGGETSPVCQSLDQAAVESAFGGTKVTFARSQSSGCQIRAEDGRSMIVAVFDYLKLSDYAARSGATPVTIGGYPGVKTSTTILYVGRTKGQPDAAGLLAAYFSGLRDGGDPIATKVLELLLPKYKKD